MASTSSLGAQSKASNEHIQTFYDSFNARLRGIRSRIEEANDEVAVSSILEDVARARTSLTAETESLPSYERHIHEQHLREVNEMLNRKRSNLAPKAKFAFKRRAKAGQKSEIIPHSQHNTVKEKPLSLLISNSLSIEHQKGQHLTLEELSSKSDKLATDLHLMDLEDCIVDLRDTERRPKFLALQIRNLRHCVILCGKINGSTMIHDCSETLILLECKQFRMHSSHSMAIMISTSSIATIEQCRDVYFAPLSLEQVIPQVQDFEHIIYLQQSSNWSTISRERQESIHKILCAHPLSPLVWLRAAGLAPAQ